MRLIASMACGLGLATMALSATAQTLFTYGDNKVSKTDFLRVYQKNNLQNKTDFSAKAVTEYLDLYALFRMKVKEAEQIQLDTTAAVRNELENYKGQLARAYLSDKEVTNQLAKEAYERMKEEIQVAHILVAVRPGSDTAQAYKKIDSIYKAATSGGADFAALARQFSDDKATGANGGSIGYITALQVVYPFENAAYATKKGTIARPFRTQFGYHILKVTDRRPGQGKVQVAQIMIAAPKSRGDSAAQAANKKMNTLMGDLKVGASFEELAKQYSDDRFTKDKGGMMEPFGVGKMMPVFEQAAFALKKPGDLSDPIQTEYGIHLLKLVERIPLQPYDSIKDQLIRSVENDSRAGLAKEAYQNKVKQENGFKEYPEHFNSLLAAIEKRDTGKIVADQYKDMTATLFELSGKKYSQYDFAQYAASLTKGTLYGNRNTAIGDLYKMYQNAMLSDLQQTQLETSNVDYKNLITEYRDGILLFDLMDRKVWSKASNDSTGQQDYYRMHQAKYMWQAGFEGTVYQSNSESDLNALRLLLNAGGDATEALDQVNTVESPNKVSRQEGRFEFSRFPINASEFAAQKATSVFKNPDGSFAFVFPNATYDSPQQKSFEDARGFVIADYQDFLEKQWNQQLKEKYPVKVEDKVMKSIVK